MLSTRNFTAVMLQMLVNYLIMTYGPIHMRLDACVIATILLPLKDLTLNVALYSIHTSLSNMNL